MPALIGARRSLLAADRPPRIYQRYPFGIPGIDIPVGPQGVSAYKTLEISPDHDTPEFAALKALYPPFTVYAEASGGARRLVVQAPNVDINGWDLRGYGLFQGPSGTNTTVRDSKFDNNLGSQNYIIQHTNDVTVLNNDLIGIFTTGGGRPGEQGTAFIAPVPDSATATQIIKRNRMMNAEQNFVKPCGGLIEENYFKGVGYIPGAHACVFLCARTNADLMIRRNFGDLDPSLDNNAMWSAWYQCTSEDGPNTFAKEVMENLAAGGASVFYPGYHAGTGGYSSGGGPLYALTGTKIHDNYCDISKTLALLNGNGYLYNQYESSIIGTNYDVLTGVAFRTPPGNITDLQVTFTDSTHTVLTFTPVSGATGYEYWYGDNANQDMRLVPGNGSQVGSAWPALPAGNPAAGITISGPNNGAYPWWRVRAVKTPFAGNKGNQVAGNSTPATTA